MNKKAKGAIAAVAAISAAVGAVFLTKKVGAFLKEGRCKECGKKIDNELFTVYEPEDMAYLSRDCVDSKFASRGEVCEDCFDCIYGPAIDAYNGALDASSGVKIYFKDFQGEVDYVEEVKKVSTECFESKDEALYAIKTMAAYLECDIVFDVEFFSEVINEQSGKRVMYKVKGIIAKS
ncbi:MAG: hypothetical protein RR539_10240 [Clostridium sp.]|uniref:hypothetical protein n=1 Tax=Clostridium sp. TaxID=1506 RepID=UPI002FCB5134